MALGVVVLGDSEVVHLDGCCINPTGRAWNVGTVLVHLGLQRLPSLDIWFFFEAI